jgi:hypothetical protein
MARRHKEKTADNIKLRQPDRSAPSEETLLQMARDRGLFDKAEQDPRNKRRVAEMDGSGDVVDDEGSGLSPTAERAMEAMLWTVSLAMLHFTLDVLVQHQYAVAIKWVEIASRTGQAFLGKVRAVHFELTSTRF